MGKLNKKKQISLELREWGLLTEMLQILIINKQFSILTEKHEEKLQDILTKLKMIK